MIVQVVMNQMIIEHYNPTENVLVMMDFLIKIQILIAKHVM